MKKILPEYFVDKNLDKIDDKYAIRFLQNELNEILNSFVNGGYSKKGYIFHPILNSISRENKIKLRRLMKVAHLLNKKGYDFTSSLKFRKINNRNFALVISSLYRNYGKLKEKGNKRIIKKKCREFDIKDYKKEDLKFLIPLDKLKNYVNIELKKYLAGFYLHGSFATKDYVKDWSDADTTMLISKKILENPKYLLKLRKKMYNMRKFFYEMDPLQHHGSMVITECDLTNYSETYFPVEIFKNSLSMLKNDKKIEFNVRNSSEESLKKLFWFVNYFRKINIEKRFKMGSYDTKILLHSITLFPALYLQAKNVSISKKNSFNKARKDFTKKEWEVIDKVSSIRNNWQRFDTVPLIKSFSRINPIISYQLNSRIVDVIGKKNNIDVKNIAKDMLELSEKTWEKVKKNAKI